MTDILDKILNNPATAYLLNFGGLAVLLNLAIHGLRARLSLSDRAQGVIAIAAGAVGGILTQAVGFVTLPGGSGLITHVMAAFAGMASALAAAGFSDLDLRSVVKKQEGAGGN